MGFSLKSLIQVFNVIYKNYEQSLIKSKIKNSNKIPDHLNSLGCLDNKIPNLSLFPVAKHSKNATINPEQIISDTLIINNNSDSKFISEFYSLVSIYFFAESPPGTLRILARHKVYSIVSCLAFFTYLHSYLLFIVLCFCLLHSPSGDFAENLKYWSLGWSRATIRGNNICKTYCQIYLEEIKSKISNIHSFISRSFSSY